MNITQIIEDGPDCYSWREVFAFFPVKTFTGKRIWWKKVWKKRIWVTWGASFHMEPMVFYGDSFDILCDFTLESLQC